MPQDATLVGWVLVAVLPVVVWDTINTYRGGFDNAFWQLTLDEKLDRIPDHVREWHRLSLDWVVINGLLIAGLAAFTFQLSAAGEPAWAALGFGAFLLVAIAFVVVVLFMSTAVSSASIVRRESGTTPDWLASVWQASWWVERSFVIGANLAYVAWGVGIVDSGFPSEWVGWVAIITGGLIALWASFSDYIFQHLALLTPIALGVALILD
jgi:hypothetical protein